MKTRLLEQIFSPLICLLVLFLSEVAYELPGEMIGNDADTH
ncbi:hypothetical protein [Ktedonosporobacter rubrisoli]|nr:hypothetical protein [Ktedonosporobacter rubrisoli]